METTATAFVTEKSPGDVLPWEDKKRFQALFADQAIRSYVYLSLGMGLVAAALPIALVLTGGYDGHYSISTFYHVSDLTRNIMVGCLCAEGVFLILFHGLSKLENWILNVAGVAAIAVAMNPMPVDQCGPGPAITLHAASAIVFFLCLATVAYVLLRCLRQFGLQETELAPAQAGTIRVRLLKLGAVVRVSVRRGWVALSEAYPLRTVFVRAWANLRALAAPPVPAEAAPASG